MSAMESIDTRELASRARQITQRELRRVHQAHRRFDEGHRAGPQGACPWACRRASSPTIRIRSWSAGRRLRGWRTSTAIATSTSTSASARCSPAIATRSCASAIERQLDDGTLFVTPCELNADVAEMLAARYNLPMWRFTNSGTEATMDAIRVARGHDRPRQDRQGRRRLPRSPRRGDDLDEAADQRGRAGRRTTGHPGHGRHHPSRAGRHQGHPVQPSRVAREGARRSRRGVLHRRAGHGEHRHLPAAARATCRPSARSLASTARC